MFDLNPKELEIKLRALYNEWDKTFSYYVDFKANQLTMPNGVKVLHKSTWNIGAYGYPSLSYGNPEFHVWDHSSIHESDYRDVLNQLAKLAEHVVADDERRSAARMELILAKTQEVNEKIKKLEEDLERLPVF